MLDAAGIALGEDRHRTTNVVPVDRVAPRLLAAAVGDANPLWWDDDLAVARTGGLLTPPTMVSAWFRPEPWRPDGGPAPVPLPTHFDLKAALGLPAAVVVESELVVEAPVFAGADLTLVERVRGVGPLVTTRLGTGRRWRIEVVVTGGPVLVRETFTCFGYEPHPDTTPPTARPAPTEPTAAGEAWPTLAADVSATTVALGAFAARDHRPIHHDPAAARAAGVAEVFLDTPTQQAFFARAITDVTGPEGHLRRLRLRMRRPVLAGDHLVIGGTVTARRPGELDVALTLTVEDETRSTAEATVRLAR